MSHAIIIEPNDLDRLINSLREEIRLGFEKSRAINIDPPLSKKQAAKFLCISVQTLDRRLKSGDIPSKFIHGKGKMKSFFASELELYIRKS